MAITTTAGKFVKDGQTLDYTPTSAVSCGDLIVVDGAVCLAPWDIAANTAGTLKILQRGEVVSITTDDAIGATNAGVAIYVIPASGLVTKSANDGGNPATDYKLLGYAAAAIGATDKTFEVVCA